MRSLALLIALAAFPLAPRALAAAGASTAPVPALTTPAKARPKKRAVKAAPATPLPPPAPPDDPLFRFEPNTALWASGTYRHVGDDAYNPGNALAQAPYDTETFEVRPDWRVSGNKWRLTFRPRALLTREDTKVLGNVTSRNLALLRWSEAFLTVNLSESWSVDYGLQNFQWGPAESASPSNRIVRDTIQVKDTLYLVKGHHLARLSYTPTSSFSEILLFEPTGNGDPEPEPNEPFRMKGVSKTELSWDGGASFAGLVGGWRDRSGFNAGEYVNLQPFDGFFVYADAEQQRGTLAYYPVLSNGLVTFQQNRRDEGGIQNFVVGGVRYAFENGNDWRLEAIYQENGYTKDELKNSAAAISSRDPIQLRIIATQSSAVLASGLDFPSKNYLFSSIRFPNVLQYRDWNIYVRGLDSLQDHSFAGFLSSENRVGNHGTVISGVSATGGKAGTELKGVVDLAGTLAYRHAW